jgi:hypothetical protein
MDVLDICPPVARALPEAETALEEIRLRAPAARGTAGRRTEHILDCPAAVAGRALARGGERRRRRAVERRGPAPPGYLSLPGALGWGCAAP